MDLVCTWHTGPDSGARQRITWHPGDDGTMLRAVIGRGGRFRCDDGALQAHHVLVEVRALLDTDGTAHDAEVWAVQLAGTGPVRTGRAALAGRSRLANGDTLTVGTSTCTLEVLPSTEPGIHAVADSDTVSARAQVVVARVPRTVPGLDDLAVVEHLRRSLGPTMAGASATAADAASCDAAIPMRERPGGLVPTLVGVAGSAAVAMITGRPMFLAFGAVGSLVALTSWAGQWIAFGRRHRRSLDERRQAVAQGAAARAATRAAARVTVERITPTLLEARRTIEECRTSLWSCRANDADAFLAGLGTGDLRIRPHGTGHIEVLADAPVAVALGPGERLALRGPLADAVARALVVQLATRCGPADLRLIVDAPGWEWACSLPHALWCAGSDDAGSDIALGEIAAHPGTHGPAHLVIVTANSSSLADPASPLRRLLDRSTAALIAICGQHPAPSCSTALIETEAQPTVFVPDVRHTRASLAITVAGLGSDAAASCAAALARHRDPEVLGTADQHLPAAIDIDELTDVETCSPSALCARWSSLDNSLRAPLGVTRGHDGTLEPVVLDLVADGPHALVAGTTGSGKSELLRTLVVGLARHAPPHRLSLVLVDYKGGAAFDAVAGLPHVAGVITDLDDRLADRLLRSLDAEIRRREAFLRAHRLADLGEACRLDPRAASVPPRLVVVVDEFAALVAERPSFLHALVGVAQRGRSLGLHLVLATQRPTGVVSDDIRANTSVRIALRLHDRADALDIVGDDAPVSLPRRHPGRAVLRDGDRCIVMQSARCTQLASIVDTISAAAALAGSHPAPAPWTPPLPAELDALPAAIHDAVDAVGIIDDPDQQRYLPLTAPPANLGLLVAGSRGSGVTSTLAAVTASIAGRYAAVVVVDAACMRGTHAGGHDPWAALEERGIVQRLGHDDERLVRLVRLLERTDHGERMLVVLDDLDALRRALAGPAHDHRIERRHDSRVDQLLGALLGAASNADLVVGTADPSSVPPPLLSRCTDRWVLHLADPAGAAALGVPARLIPAPVPGRLVVDGREAQVLAPCAAHSRRAPAGTVTVPLAAVPRLLHPSALPPPKATASSLDLAIGIDLETGEPARLTVAGGEHVLITGGPRSGKSNAVRVIGAALRTVAPGRRIVPLDDIHLGTTGSGGIALDDTGSASAPIIVAAGPGDALRQRADWWSAMVRRIRCGLVLAGPDAAVDGELFGLSLPRGFPVDVHPGRGWLVDHGRITVVQLARCDVDDECCASVVAPPAAGIRPMRISAAPR